MPITPHIPAQESPQKPHHSIRTRLMNEWHHFQELPPLTLALLGLSSLLLVVINPLVPILAYGLQHWAATSWTWRDRWASVIATARKGGLFITCLLTYLVLNQTHVWIVPEITTILHTIWQAYLPGDLSLSPLDGQALVARILLFLPLTPIIAVLYEYLDPRTHHPLTRVLTPVDMKEPEIPSAPPPTPTPSPSSTTTPAQKKRKSTKQRPKESKTVQVTIDSFLASTPSAPATSSASEIPSESSSPSPPAPQDTTSSPTEIDWDDVAE